MNAKNLGALTAFVCGTSMLVEISACSSSSSSKGTACPVPAGCPAADPAATELTTPAVSFATDIVPVFQASCSLSSSCHQLQQGGPSLLYLGGEASKPADGAGIFAAIVDKPSVELASMMYVKSGDPANSFLMHKLDGDECELASQCGATPVPSCGEPMPMSGCALAGTTRDKFRRWIAQGAKNN